MGDQLTLLFSVGKMVHFVKKGGQESDWKPVSAFFPLNYEKVIAYYTE